uniref:(California timema) hypothetical protein n=1 Tax=Timema californicum TaxID=61474 RepID=A0A7R9P864_TIMCA|nr:unnamed protein product [Timema californicum]
MEWYYRLPGLSLPNNPGPSVGGVVLVPQRVSLDRDGVALFLPVGNEVIRRVRGGQETVALVMGESRVVQTVLDQTALTIDRPVLGRTRLIVDRTTVDGEAGDHPPLDPSTTRGRALQDNTSLGPSRHWAHGSMEHSSLWTGTGCGWQYVGLTTWLSSWHQYGRWRSPVPHLTEHCQHDDNNCTPQTNTVE